ncbi:unnamed protein product, partial [Timema podura]|nr:unnamed protein product [Timema podura]
INWCRDPGLNPGPTAQKSDTLPPRPPVHLPQSKLLVAPLPVTGLANRSITCDGNVKRRVLIGRIAISEGHEREGKENRNGEKEKETQLRERRTIMEDRKDSNDSAVLKMSVSAMRDEQMTEGWRTSPNTPKPPLLDPRLNFFDWLMSPRGEDGVEVYDENKERILKKLKSLLESGEKSDVTFLVGKKEKKQCHAHKLVLSLRSPVFEAMCFGPMAEKNEIVVPDIEPETFHKLLCYIYTNSVSLTDVESSCEILYAAKKYMCDGLVEECRKNISYLLDSNNVCPVFETMIYLDEQELMYDCCNVIRQKTSEVIKHPSFLNLRKDTLEILLGEDYLSVDSELDLLDAALRWTVRRCDVEGLEVNAVNKRRIMRPFFKKIVFLSLSAQQFVSATVLRDILTAEEYRDIISNIIESNSCALPPGFCAKLSRRCNFCFNGSPRAMKKSLGFCPHCNLQSCCTISVTYNAKQLEELEPPVEELDPPVEELDPPVEEIDPPQWRNTISSVEIDPSEEELYLTLWRSLNSSGVN